MKSRISTIQQRLLGGFGIAALVLIVLGIWTQRDLVALGALALAAMTGAALWGTTRAAEEERRRLATVLDALPAGVVITDAKGGVTHVNAEFRRIWGGPPTPHGRHEYDAWRGWWPDTGRPLDTTEWALVRALANGEVIRPGHVVEIARLDGSGRATILDAAAPIRNAAGAVIGGVLAVVDVTAQKRAEAAARQAEQAVREANAQLRDADRRKDEFLGMLSHELRNPLAPIRNALYILDRADPGGPQARRARDIANRQVAHLTRLVDDLLDVTRIVRGKVELRRVDLDLDILARRAADDHRALMQERSLELELHLSGEPVRVHGDETRLAQVLGNLLNNAAKFTPAGGRVTLDVRAVGGQAELRVRDTGAGISPDVLPTIFEPFTQAQQTLARSEGGLGLGLAMVRGLVALHEGEVRVASAGLGQGTEFVITLPLAAHRAAGAQPMEQQLG